MQIQTLINHTQELLKVCLSTTQPVDKFLSQTFAKKKSYGSKERKFITNTIYFYLRNKILIDYLHNEIISEIKDTNNNNLLILLTIAYAEISSDNYAPREILKNLFSEDEYYSIYYTIPFGSHQHLFDKIKNIIFNIEKDIALLNIAYITNSDFDKIELRYSFPKWIIKSIIRNFRNYDDLITFLQNSLKQAPITIRINNPRINYTKVLDYFRELKYDFEQSDLVPNSIKFTNRISFQTLESYKSGMFEIQDEGSQLVSFFLNPLPKEKILDACAGAGGKSLHIADIQFDTGLIVANDIEYSKLKELKHRALRSGFQSIIINHYKFGQNSKLLKLGYFDKVLVDAPCSGLGTIRRDPIRKYRIDQNYLQKLVKKQIKILTEYSRYVRIGGELVYATCSIMNDENLDVIKNFIEQNQNFEPVDIIEFITQYSLQERARLIGENYFSIDFGKTSADGFFMAKFRRSS